MPSFSDRAEKELDSTRKVYDRLAAASESFQRPTTEAVVYALYSAILREVGHGRALSDEVAEAIMSCIAALYIDEGLDDLPEMDWRRPLGMEEGVRLRNEFRRLQKLYGHGRYVLDVLSEVVGEALTLFVEALPAAAWKDSETPQDGFVLSVSLGDLIREPGQTINAISAQFYQKPAGISLFDGLVDRLVDNTLATGHRGKNWTIAADAKAPPRELVRTYLSGTPLLDLFRASVPLIVPEDVRFEHMHVVGGTGHGKSQLLQYFIYEDLQRVAAGEASVVVIDSQGDLIRTISHLVEFGPGRENGLADRLILIDPDDVEHPAALNMFDVNRDRISTYSRADQERILNGAVELYEYMFGSLFGAELTQKQGVIFRYLARLMMTIPDATIQTLRELMEDGTRFRPYWQQLEGTARIFFEQEFCDPSFNATKKQILKRLWGVLANPTFERMFSHPRNKVDMFEAINGGKVILINTAKDLLKQEGCEIFGRFFIAMVAQAALERAAMPQRERMPTYVYIDEAHDYFDESIEHLLNQARKYRVGMALAHQNLDQLSQRLRASIMASTSIKLMGGLSAKDARTLAPDMRCEPEFLQSMRKYTHASEFACWIKNQTPQAIEMSVPLGYVNMLPQLSEDEYAELVDANRARLCATLDETEAYISRAYAAQTSEPLLAGRVRSTKVSEYVDSSVTSELKEPDTPPRPKQEVKPKRMRRQQPPPLNDPYLAGQGSKQHKYIQHLIKRAAQERGYSAVIEHGLEGGAGSVDVALEQGDQRIACEVSITTKPEHELANIRKCLQAGYKRVLVVAEKQRHLSALRKHAEVRLAPEELRAVRFVQPSDAIRCLDELAATTASSETTVRGYKVKVTHTPIDPGEVERRRENIASVIAKSVTRLS